MTSNSHELFSLQLRLTDCSSQQSKKGLYIPYPSFILNLIVRLPQHVQDDVRGA